MQIYWTKINKIIEENSNVKTYLLDRPKDFIWEDGAHTHFALKGFEDQEDKKSAKQFVRHMSISTTTDEDVIGITTRIKDLPSYFKEMLKNCTVGDEVALFKTHSNVPLRREDKNIYLLSAGVGLATFRPLALDYLKHTDNINSVHSLNVDSSREFLFTDVFESTQDKNFTSEFVDNRQNYYEKVENIASDKDGLFYVVGSDEFLKNNVEVLQEHGIEPSQIVLDKYEVQRPEFFSA